MTAPAMTTTEAATVQPIQASELEAEGAGSTLANATEASSRGWHFCCATADEQLPSVNEQQPTASHAAWS